MNFTDGDDVCNVFKWIGDGDGDDDDNDDDILIC